MQYHGKLGKMLQNLSSAAVGLGQKKKYVCLLFDENLKQGR